MRIPSAVYDILKKEGLIKISSVQGTAAFPWQTVFLPESLETLNLTGEFSIMPPRW